MDMSDKIVAVEADDLERDRVQLRAEGLRHRPASFGHFAGYSIGRKLKLMFGTGVGAAIVLGAAALFAIGGSDGAADGLLMTMSVMAVVVAAIGAMSIRFVQTDLVHPLEEVCNAMRELAEGNREVHVPHEDRQDEIGQFARALKIFRDSTVDRMRLEKALLDSRVAQETAETSSRVKSEFLANMSHELRTPLNAVIGFSDIMQHQVKGPLSAAYQEYAALINESGNHLLNLVSDILDLAKIEAGKFLIDPHEMDLVETVDLCLRLTQRRAEAGEITLVKSVSQPQVMLTADSRACKQILLNLLSNAVKFTRRGGMVEVIAAPDGDRVFLKVRDTGIGIPADLLPRIGNAFEQASNDPMLAREGTGLGLALVKALVDQHGGRVSIASKENFGTTVSIELPRAQPDRAAA